MSAFICSNYHFQSILTTLQQNKSKLKSCLLDAGVTFNNADFEANDNSIIIDPVTFVGDLYAKNISSVIAKYSDASMLGDMPIEDFAKTEKGKILTIAQFKGALRCLRYQIETDYLPPAYDCSELDNLDAMLSALDNFKSEGWEVNKPAKNGGE